ncbi:MAG: ubiquinone anaerobic biosynthesis protein UbiV [Micavibrio sp.]
MKPQLAIGPIQFHWPAQQWKDFYFRMADESPVDVVYIGEVICSKRAPFYEPLYEEVAERLRKAEKKIVFSTLAEVMIKHDRRMVSGMTALEETMVEANDASALYHLSGRPHTIGPFMNVYNENTLTFLSLNGAEHVCFPPELPGESLSILSKRANQIGITTEVQVYGRIPLALSARCYHARAHGRVKDNCQFVCEQDIDGMPLKTLQGKSFLAINGIATMSHTCLNLVQELADLQDMGINHFRLSPHSHDMVNVSTLFRAALDRSMDIGEIIAKLADERPDIPFSNGFFHQKRGHDWVTMDK